MTKELKYSGLSSMPSDYNSPDGDLTLSLGLINEDGGLRAIQNPTKELQLNDGHRLLIIHRVAQQENYIFLSGDSQSEFTLGWKKRDTSATTLPQSQYSAPIQSNCTLRRYIDIAIVGNTLALATDDGVYYILWKDNTYKFLGDKPPFLPIAFGAYQAGILKDTATTTYTDVPSGIVNQYVGAPNGSSFVHPQTNEQEDSERFWKTTSNQALGLLLKQASKISQQGYLYQPFFIRYAYRLYDGSYSWHSAPILMLVAANRPIIYIRPHGYPNGELSITNELDIPYFGIAYSILSDVDSLKQWSDIITGIDIFISQPIYTFDQSEDLAMPDTLKCLYDGIYSGGGWSSGLRGRTNPSSSTTQPSDNSQIFVGHYATSDIDPNDGSLIIGDFVDHFVNTTTIDNDKNLVCPLSKHPQFNDKIQHEHLFYKILSLDIDEINGNTPMVKMPLTKADLREINTLTCLEDDYNSHFKIRPASLHTYNSRLLLTDCRLTPPAPFPMAVMAQAASDTESQTSSSDDPVETIKVYTRINGVRCVSQLSVTSSIYPYDSSFPRFVYHPDPNAYRMEIITASGEFIAMPLKQHPYLNGAYWFGGLGGEAVNFIQESDDDVVDFAHVSNKAYISDVNNPFIFPAQYAVTIDCGRIFRLSSAAKALSQGQFGQFPLYAFTDQGVWAMEISSTGTISARQPFTRDVCINPAAITQIDSAVLFPTDRGIMLVSGSQTQCISDIINSNEYFNPLSLPALSRLTPNCPEMPPLHDFLVNCGMAYDYIHQRIILFNADKPFAYVYSLKTKLWGMMLSSIQYTVNSYPMALAVDSSNFLVNYSTPSETNSTSLVLSRPIKLDSPDIHKTIDSIIQRGFFRRGHVQSILYGSRDLYNWHLIWSSKNHCLRGFRGTPYKYFRVALLSTLSPDESIYGASVQFTPRLTNHPR